MTQSGYREALVDYIRAQAKPPDKFSHQPRLYQLAKRLAEGQPYDDDVLYAAAWLHDLGVFIGHRPEDPAALAAWDHVAYANRQAPGVLRQLGFPEGKIPAVHGSHSDASAFEQADFASRARCCGMRTSWNSSGPSPSSAPSARWAATRGLCGMPTRCESCAGMWSNCPRNCSSPPRAASPARASKTLKAFLAAAEAEADGNEL